MIIEGTHYVEPRPDWKKPFVLRKPFVAYRRILHQDIVDSHVLQWDEEWFPKETVVQAIEVLSLEDKFLLLASEWENATKLMSSLDDKASDTNYRSIIELDWPVLRFMLSDLRSKGRYWFPALRLITKICPYDRSDEGNIKRMTKAWIEWGQRKGLI
jgi:hypothetical protein